MSSRRKALGRAPIVVVAVIALIVGTMGFLALSSQPGAPASQTTAPATTTTSSATPSATSSTTSSQGLRLMESVNASTITVGESLSVSMSIVNTLPTINDILASDDWPFQGVPVALWPACYLGLPAQAVVLQGNYSLQELKTVANTTFSYVCMEGVRVDRVIFQPGSDTANITGSYSVDGSNQTLGPFQMTLSYTTSGYWNLTSLAGTPATALQNNSPVLSGEGQPDYTAFSPGVYTIAVDDEWGQTVVTHITVLPSGSSSSSTTSASSQSMTTYTCTTAPSGVGLCLNSPANIQLLFSLSADQISAGGTVLVNVTELNLLNRVNNVTTSSDWRVPAALSSCPNTNVQPFGIAVYEGHYTTQNVSQGTQLQIFPATVCPMYERLVTGYAFQPDSDLAVVLPGSGLTPMTASVDVANAASGSGQSLPLNPGQYTVVAADEWGGLAFLYFQVDGPS